MFAKRKRGGLASQSLKRRKLSVQSPEEITFDFNAREDYLTGFHKRKLQRTKHAQEEAAKREREERIKARKIMRDNRKADAEKHVQEVNALMKEAQKFVGGYSEDSETEAESEAEDQEWEGIAEPVAIDHEDEYSDEDRHTTVTIEAVDITRDGFQKAKVDLDGTINSDEEEDGRKNTSGTSVEAGTEKQKQKRVWTKEKPKQPKKKKKKFRYETKSERKVTRMKERSGGKAQARARREKE